MENILAFIKEQKITYLATIDGDQARVRPMNGLSEIDGKLTWCTNNQKDMFKQVVMNPKVEVCMFSAGKTVRISGRCVPTKDEAIKAKYLELQPSVAKLYGGKEDTLEVLVFETAQAIITAGPNKDIVEIY
jgi:uncharacterized pyridoxamine 5'-phosphate oxidase family protein